jgi:flagellar hook-associated protein 2
VQLTSSGTTFDGVVQGLSLEILQTSNDPVTVTVTEDVEAIVRVAGGLAEKFNQAVDQIDELVGFDTETNQRGLLFGDATMRNLRNNLFRQLLDPARVAGPFRTLSAIGFDVIGQTGDVAFNESEFRLAFAKDPGAVKDLLTNTEIGIGTRFSQALEFVTDPIDGTLSREVGTKDILVESLRKRIEQLTERLESKRQQLFREFVAMEKAFLETQSILQRLGAALQPISGGGGGGGGIKSLF